MMYSVTIRPYGENEKGELVTDFEEDDLEIIKDLFSSLGKKCVEEYDDIKEVLIEREDDLITINYRFCGEEEISEDDFLFYLETLIGHNSNNILSFDEEEYSIKGSPIVSKKKVTFNCNPSSGEKAREDDEDYEEKMYELLKND